MSSGTSIKEIQRFFEYLKQSKTNNEMTILITNDMCKGLQFMVENLCNYRDLLEQRIDKAIEYIKTTDRWLCRVNDELCIEAIGKDKLLEILGGINENNNN